METLKSGGHDFCQTISPAEFSSGDIGPLISGYKASGNVCITPHKAVYCPRHSFLFWRQISVALWELFQMHWRWLITLIMAQCEKALIVCSKWGFC